MALKYSLEIVYFSIRTINYTQYIRYFNKDYLLP
jgi:hypothetical protein